MPDLRRCRHSPLALGAQGLGTLSLALALALPRAARADLRPLSVVPYGPERGLSGHPVTAIAQDRWSRLWVATLGGGVFRYDGLAWRTLTTRDGLLSDRVTALVPGAHGEMWISTASGNGSPGGLVIAHEDRLLPPVEGASWEARTGLEARSGAVWFGLRAGGVARYASSVLEPVSGLESTRVLRVLESRDGTLWFVGRPVGATALANGSLHRYDGTAFRALGEAEGVPKAPLTSLLEDRAGRLWLGTGSGLRVLVNGRFEPPAVDGALLTTRAVHALFEDGDSALWAGLDGGAMRIAYDVATELALPAELGPLPVLSLGASPSGGLFLMTPTHLIRLEGESGEVLELTRAGDALGADAVPEERLKAASDLEDVLETNGSVLVDHEGGVWAIDGGRVVRYAGDEARRYGRGEGLASDDVRSVHVDSKGQVWAGTAGGVSRLDAGTGLFVPVSSTRDAIEALYEDRGGAVYAATPAGVLRIDGLDAKPWAPAKGVDRPHGFVADENGRLWIASEQGLARSSADGLQTFAPRDGTAEGPARTIARIEGEIWAGHDQGLTHVAGTRVESVPAFRGIKVTGLLPTGSVAPPRLLAVTTGGLRSIPDGALVPPAIPRTALHAAHRSPAGVFWMALDAGVLETSGGAEVLHAGGTFPSVPVRAFAEDNEGRMWLATARGLYRHAPRKGPPSARIVDTIGATSGTASGTASDAASVPLVLGGLCRDLIVRYAGVSFIGPRDAADLRFETRLRPVETDWSLATDERFKALRGLKAGSYTFEVRSVSRDLLRSATAALTFTVGTQAEQPPAPRLVLPDIARP